MANEQYKKIEKTSLKTEPARRHNFGINKTLVCCVEAKNVKYVEFI